MDVLPSSYQDARTRFLDAAKVGDHSLSSYALENFSGPGREELACDVMSIRGQDATTCIVTTSAIHGVEGYLGSYLQTLWAGRDGMPPVDIIHVHALNPHGFAYDRRADQENIDVNRNFQPRWPAPEINPLYAAYADVIVPEQGGLVRNSLAELRTIRALISPGMTVMKDIITKGQYSTPSGMYYGGAAPSWSRQVWEKILVTRLSHYARVIHLDLHTGLGDSGTLQIIAGSDLHPQAMLARKAWGDRLAFMHTLQGENTSLSSVTTGGIENSWNFAEPYHHADAATYTFEFGTLPPLDVFRALRADHSAYAYREASPERLDEIRRQMRRAFAPDDATWLNKAVVSGNAAYDAILAQV